MARGEEKPNRIEKEYNEMAENKTAPAAKKTTVNKTAAADKAAIEKAEAAKVAAAEKAENDKAAAVAKAKADKAAAAEKAKADNVAARVAAVRKWAIDHYDYRGWDILVETYSDEDIAKVIGDTKSDKVAINRARRPIRTAHANRVEIQSA